MTDVVLRLLLVGAIFGLALAAAMLARRFQRPVHPAVMVGSVGDRPGVVVFTATDCSTCKDTLAKLQSASVPYREVTWELESHRFETWEVLAVPLTVVLDAEGIAVGTISGVPRDRVLERAIGRAGIDLT